MEKINRENAKTVSGRCSSKALFMKQHECKLCAHYQICTREICRFDKSVSQEQEEYESK